MRSGSGGTPAGALVGGRINDPAEVGRALLQLLARSEIHESRALIAASDTVATFRILNLPASTQDANVDSVVAKEFPVDDERLATRWTEVHTNATERTVFAAAWDRAQVKAVGDAVRAAGVEPNVIDLKSACLARAVTTGSCILVDVTVDPAEVVLIDNHLPQLWRRLESGVTAEDLVTPLVEPLRAVLRFSRRGRNSSFDPESPIYISSDQPPPQAAMAQLNRILGQPVTLLPSPSRVPDIRYATYLACIGLLMRRT